MRQFSSGAPQTSVANSTICRSAQYPSDPAAVRSRNPQCPPCGVTCTRTNGFCVELGLAERRGRDERIVFGGDDQRRHADAIDDAHRAGAVVVVLGAREAEVRRGVGLVELAHGPDLVEPVEREAVREALRPSAASAPSVRARSSTDRRCCCAARARARTPPAPSPARPRRRLAAPAAARRRNRRPASARGCRRASSRRRRCAAMPSRATSSRITKPASCGQARMIEARREVLGAAAVALIQPDDVEAAREGLVGDAAHVVRGARSLEPVQQDQQRMARSRSGCQWQCASTRVSAATSNSRSSGGGRAGNVAACAPAVDRHPVAAAAQPPGHVVNHREWGTVSAADRCG